jgi:hypothetical protein
MKKIIFPILLALSVISCDRVSEQDYLQTLIPADTTGGTAIRKVLLEDYTGHQCGNCPEAGEKATQLQALYGEKIVVMSVHAGFFARTAPVKYTTNYANEVSTGLDGFFRISAAGNPNGMINRRDYPASQHVKSLGNWGTLVAEELNKPLIATLKLTPSFSSSDSMITLQTASKFPEAYTGNVKIVVYITEDSIVGYQKDYRLSGDQDIPDYLHRHVLRGSMNTAFGDQLNSAATPAAGETFTKTFTYKAGNWNLKHCSLVAVLYDATTFEVLQVEEKHIQ